MIWKTKQILGQNSEIICEYTGPRSFSVIIEREQYEMKMAITQTFMMISLPYTSVHRSNSGLSVDLNSFSRKCKQQRQLFHTTWIMRTVYAACRVNKTKQKIEHELGSSVAGPVVAGLHSRHNGSIIDSPAFARPPPEPPAMFIYLPLSAVDEWIETRGMN